MKKIILSTIIALTSTFGLNAQLTEGHTSYKVDVQASNPEMAMVVGMMQGSTAEIYNYNKLTRSEVKMGTMNHTINIMDLEKQTGITLMSGMIGKIVIKQDLKKLNEEAGTPKYTVTQTTETKDVIGYTCTKTILTLESGVELVYWLTDKIGGNLEGQQMYFEGINGFPLEYQMDMQGLLLTYTATKVETSLTKEQKKTLFDMSIPAGYTEKTMEDMMKMMGGQ